jgi:hypothetical protein
VGHSGVAEDRLRVNALAIKAREKGCGGRPIKTTVVEAETDPCGIRQKILASETREKKLTPAKPFKMDVRLLIVKRKGGLQLHVQQRQNLQLSLIIVMLRV